MRRRQSWDNDPFHHLRNAYDPDLENRSRHASYDHSLNHPDTFYPQQSEMPLGPSYDHVEHSTYDSRSRVGPEPSHPPQYKPNGNFEIQRRLDLVDPFEEYKESVKFTSEFWEEYNGHAHHNQILEAFGEDQRRAEEFWQDYSNNNQADRDIDPFELDQWDEYKWPGDDFYGL